MVTTLRHNTVPLDRRRSDSGGTAASNAEVIVCGCDDGAVTVRPTIAPMVYARIQAHDGDASVTGAACSYDGEWIVSSDSDGLLAVHRCRRRPFEVSNSSGADQWLARLGEHSRSLMVLREVLERRFCRLMMRKSSRWFSLWIDTERMPVLSCWISPENPYGCAPVY